MSPFIFQSPLLNFNAHLFSSRHTAYQVQISIFPVDLVYDLKNLSKVDFTGHIQLEILNNIPNHTGLVCRRDVNCVFDVLLSHSYF